MAKPSEEEIADGALDAGINYAIERLCEILDVDPKSISWDAATETMDGDVSSVICNAIRAAYGEEWSSKSEDTARIRSALTSPARWKAIGEEGLNELQTGRFMEAALANEEHDIRVNGGDLRITGVSRDAENSKVLILSLTRTPTDDEMRTIHDLFGQSRYVTESPLIRAARNATKPIGLRRV